ncbi:MAG: PKD domain-containing protein, partial [Bacteroidetes bacterium]
NNSSEYSTRYLWDFGDGGISEETNPVYTYNAPGEYTIRLIADNEIGCPNEYEFGVVNVLNFNIFYPNAFSPNGDGHNDEFFIVMNSIEVFEIQIFDRWGRKVFASANTDFRWDGTLNGQASPEGVYTYLVKATTYRGERFERAGSVTLIR